MNVIGIVVMRRMGADTSRFVSAGFSESSHFLSVASSEQKGPIEQ